MQTQTLKRITDIAVKTAEVLAVASLIDDHYHNNIKEGALEQVRLGNPLSVYGGQHDKAWWHTEIEWEALQASHKRITGK